MINNSETIVSVLMKPSLFFGIVVEVSMLSPVDDTLPNVISQTNPAYTTLNPITNMDVNVSPAMSSFEQQFI
jgi:hypothetical protein